MTPPHSYVRYGTPWAWSHPLGLGPRNFLQFEKNLFSETHFIFLSSNLSSLLMMPVIRNGMKESVSWENVNVTWKNCQKCQEMRLIFRKSSGSIFLRDRQLTYPLLLSCKSWRAWLETSEILHQSRRVTAWIFQVQDNFLIIALILK